MAIKTQERAVHPMGGRRPPSANEILELARHAIDGRDRAAVLSVLHTVLDEERASLSSGAAMRTSAHLADALQLRLESLPREGLTPVINATGVILHTNLGRAPWAEAAIRAAERAASGYLFLEMDRRSGRRGPRFALVESHLRALTGAEAALVVNNNAAAVSLSLAVAGRRAAVAVARGELAEIGGGVRIPELIRRAGARLVEVGTTNRTRLADFEGAFDAGHVGAVLRVHASNFRIEGFTERASLADLVALARRRRVPIIEDLGSGALLDTQPYGLEHEPLPAESLQAGVDLVTFSGDKLVGGPQAGLIVGRAALIARLRRDPLARAMRPDKVTLAALAATLALYRSGEAALKIPIWRMISAATDDLRRRAAAIAASVQVDGSAPTVESVESTIGGGSLPGETVHSAALSIAAARPDRLHRMLRMGEPAVVGRVHGSAVILDLRTVLPEQDGALVVALRALSAGPR